MWQPHEDTATNRQIIVLLHRDGDRCHYCRRPFTDDRPATREHLTPRSQGGSGSNSNLVLACRRCNSARSAYPYAWFMTAMRAWRDGEGPDPCTRAGRRALAAQFPELAPFQETEPRRPLGGLAALAAAGRYTPQSRRRRRDCVHCFLQVRCSLHAYPKH